MQARFFVAASRNPGGYAAELSGLTGAVVMAGVETRYCPAPADLYARMLRREQMLFLAGPAFLERHPVNCVEEISKVPVLYGAPIVVAGQMVRRDVWLKAAAVFSIDSP